LTNDKDFVDIVFRDGLPHAGVILFRLGYVPTDTRLMYLRRVLIDHADELGQFIVVTRQGIRIASAEIARGEST
jgi:predicted nuclease of predicted toxin-antitoxin system